MEGLDSLPLRRVPSAAALFTQMGWGQDRVLSHVHPYPGPRLLQGGGPYRASFLALAPYNHVFEVFLYCGDRLTVELRLALDSHPE